MDFSGGIGTLRTLAFCLVIIGAAALSGCMQQGAGGPDGAGSGGNNSKNPVLRIRAERDRAFKTSPQSPIPESKRAGFQNLDYFQPDPGLRFRVRLNRYLRPEPVRLATNTGEQREGLRYGFFEFVIGGRSFRLQAYRMDDPQSAGAPYLFIPFRDATSGNETYGAGRYIDLPENTSGMYDLDFNLAYNPYCAYGGDYSCPVPPKENWLPIPIRAGEKAYR